MMRICSILVLLLFAINADGQDQIPLYKMSSQLPQSINVNPAFIPDYRVVIGLPVLSSSHISINTDGNRIKDMVNVNNGQISFDTMKIAETFQNQNRFEIDGDVSLFLFGIKSGKNFYGFSANTRADADLNFDGDLLKLMILGNNDPRTQNNIINLEETWLRAQSYHEFGFIFSRQVSERLSMGITAKLIKGIIGVDFQGPNSMIAANADSISIAMDSFTINTSGVVSSRTGIDLMSGGKNYGFGLNLGGVYKINDRMSASASINDLGFIKWGDDIRSYKFKEVDYTFSGFDIFDFVDSDLNEEIISNEVDSLKELFDPEIVDGGSYRTNLTARMYVGYDFQFHKHHSTGVILYSEIIKGSINPVVSLNYQWHLSIFNLVANWSYRNNAFDNFGLGVSLNLGPIQIYGLSENVASILRQVGSSRRIDLRVGLNISIREKKPFN